MSRKFNRKAITVIVAIVAIVAVVGGSLAWFVTKSSMLQNFKLSGIDASAEVYFSDGAKTTDASAYTENGLYVLSLDKNDMNYIGNLRVDVKESGSKACVRVKILHEWRTAEGQIAQYKVNVPYQFGDYWYDNRDTDYCVYYQGKDLSGKSDFEKTTLISGFDSAAFDEAGFENGANVKLLVEVDAVQVNRVSQLWNIEKLPWK